MKIALAKLFLFLLSLNPLNSTPNNILSKPLVAFPHNHCRKNELLCGRNEICHIDFHQSLERILAVDQISNLFFSSPVSY